jgi:hypothetical protein
MQQRGGRKRRKGHTGEEYGSRLSEGLAFAVIQWGRSDKSEFLGMEGQNRKFCFVSCRPMAEGRELAG